MSDKKKNEAGIGPNRFKTGQTKIIGNSKEAADLEKSARLKEWRTRKAEVKRKSRVNTAPGREQFVPYSETLEQATIRTLTPKMVQAMISIKEWGDISVVIKMYQNQIKQIADKLKEDGKKCTGCALNPHRTRLAKKLKTDFSKDEVLKDKEIDLIKSALKTETLQVGFRNGQPYIR